MICIFPNQILFVNKQNNNSQVQAEDVENTQHINTQVEVVIQSGSTLQAEAVEIPIETQPELEDCTQDEVMQVPIEPVNLVEDDFYFSGDRLNLKH